MTRIKEERDEHLREYLDGLSDEEFLDHLPEACELKMLQSDQQTSFAAADLICLSKDIQRRERVQKQRESRKEKKIRKLEQQVNDLSSRIQELERNPKTKQWTPEECLSYKVPLSLLLISFQIILIFLFSSEGVSKFVFRGISRRKELFPRISCFQAQTERGRECSFIRIDVRGSRHGNACSDEGGDRRCD